MTNISPKAQFSILKSKTNVEKVGKNEVKISRRKIDKGHAAKFLEAKAVPRRVRVGHTLASSPISPPRFAFTRCAASGLAAASKVRGYRWGKLGACASLRAHGRPWHFCLGFLRMSLVNVRDDFSRDFSNFFCGGALVMCEQEEISVSRWIVSV